MNTMNTRFLHQTAKLSLLASVMLLASGCNQQASEPSGSSTPAVEASQNDPSHAGWWCVEHGIPEAECSMCSAKAAEACKANSDWCEEHNRAESQCFKCDPSRAEKFAQLYEAKVGQAPPTLENE